MKATMDTQTELHDLDVPIGERQPDISDAAKCYLCARFGRACSKCSRPVCPSHSEEYGDDESRQCEQECLVDVRVPVTVTFDFSLLNVKPDEVEAAIEKLCDAAVGARLKNFIAGHVADGSLELSCGTRWNPGTADMTDIGVRTHARSGGFYPWKPEAA